MINDVKAVSGTSESSHLMLIDRIVRNKIFSCRYWKEECFGLTAESLVDKAIELESIGGTYAGTRKPTPFICLVAKLLQISPEKDIIFEFIKNRDYKYVNILALFYLRLIGKPKEIYQILELFFSDYRKVRVRKQDGSYEINHIDVLIEQMLYEETLFDILLPRLPKRFILEEQDLPMRKSAIEDELNFIESDKVEIPEQPEQIQQQEDGQRVAIQYIIKIQYHDVGRSRSRSQHKEKMEKKKEKKEKKDKKEKKQKFKFKKKDKKEEVKQVIIPD